jgi:hypothetical protein
MTDAAPSPQPLPGLFARVVGVIVSPKATFERLVETPRILAMLALVSLAAGIGSSAFTFTAAGQQAFVDISAQQIERFSGQPPNDAQTAAIEKQAPFQAYITLVGSLVVIPIITAIEAGVFFLIFNVVLGGTATFKQVYAITIHSGVVSILGLLVAVPIQFARGVISMTGPANLGVLFPMLPENGVLSSFLGTIDFFRVWWVITIAIGLGVLYRRPTRGIALTLFALYLVIALGVAFVFHGR